MNNNIYIHKKSNIYNKSKKDVRNIFTESNFIHFSLEKNKISKQRSQNKFLNMMMIKMILIITLI